MPRIDDISQLRFALKDILNQIAGAGDPGGDKELEKAEDLLKATQAGTRGRDNFTIAFCGVFSSGKTSIINELLDYPGFKLPVGINPVTKLVTHISYGDDLSFYYHTDIGRTYLPRKKFNELVTGETSLPDDRRDIYVTMPAKVLSNGIVFMDTPGYNDELELEETSRAAVLDSDFVVMCTSALQFGKMFEREYMRELSDSIGNFCLVINRMDGLNTSEDEADIRTRAAKLMNGMGGPTVRSYPAGGCFFTTASGQYRNLGGLDVFMNLVISEPNRRNITASTMRNLRRYTCGLLADRANQRHSELLQRYSELLELHEKKAANLRNKNAIAESSLENKINETVNYYTTMSQDRERKLTSAAADAEKQGKYKSFQEDMKRQVSTEVPALAGDMRPRLPQGASRLQDSLAGAAGGFTVDEPRGVSKRVVSFGLSDIFIACLLFPLTIILMVCNLLSGENLFKGIFVNDVTEYRGYASNFSDKVHRALMPKVRQLGEEEIRRQYALTAPKKDIKTGFEVELNCLNTDMRRWSGVENSARALLEKL